MREQVFHEKVWKIWESAQEDPTYQKLEKESLFLEQLLKAHEDTIPVCVQDVLQEYLAKCEEMNWRVVEISCAMNQEAASEEK